jgi:amino acid adenylation domain-containing protein
MLVPVLEGFELFPREALDGSIPERFARMVEAAPNRLAILAPDRNLTYAELDAASDAVAAVLIERGGACSDPVVVLAEQSASLAIAIMGTLKAGRCYLPLDPVFPKRRLARTIERSGASIILSMSRTRELATRLAETAGLLVVEVDALGATAGGLCKRPKPDDLAYIYYTSGSTGEPKGVYDTHRNVLHNVLRYTNTLGFGPADRLTLLQRPAFSGAVSNLFGAILNGATACIFDLLQEGPEGLRRWLAAERITVYHSVPSIFRQVAADGASYEAMRVVRLEGDRASRADLELFDRYFPRHTRLVNGLGATECGLVRQFVFRPGDPIPSSVPIGDPVEDMEIVVVGPDGRTLSVDQVGEIVVRSRFLAQGYWRNPELTDQRFVYGADGVRSYRTGDQGSLDARGCLHHLGRVDFQPRFRGQLVEVEAIERALVGSTLARHVVVRVCLRPDGTERLVAYVVSSEGTRPTLTQLRTAVELNVPSASVPTDFFLLDELPTGENGKVDHSALPIPGGKRSEFGLVFPTPPRSPLESVLASIWARVLRIDRVGVFDKFRDLGGDSLMAVEMLCDVDNQLGVALPPSVLLQVSTIEELAMAIERAAFGDAPPVVLQLQGGTATPIVFATGDILGAGLFCKKLMSRLGTVRPFYAISPYYPDREPTPATIELMARERLRALRHQLPAGPCIVAGFCGPGGTLAYEMARQIEREGSRVLAVFLIDTFPILPKLRGEKRSMPVRVAIRAADKVLRAVPAFRRQVILSIGKYLTSTGQNRSWPHPDAFEAYHTAANAYEPEPIEAPLHILWPIDEPAHPSIEAFRSGWGTVAPSVKVTPVPGDHLAAVTLEVDSLAAAILEVIASVEDLPLDLN